jgi:ribosomal protein S12 methylthiotransferase accessory factor YcaO
LLSEEQALISAVLDAIEGYPTEDDEGFFRKGNRLDYWLGDVVSKRVKAFGIGKNDT